jgi:hypothetical protein
MNHLDEARGLGRAYRNFSYGTDQLEGGLELVSAEALLISIPLGWYFKSWAVGILAFFAFIVLLSTSSLFRKIWSVAFSLAVGLAAGALGAGLGAVVDKSSIAAIALGLLAGVLGFVMSLMKHGWGFQALQQNFDRGHQEGEELVNGPQR